MEGREEREKANGTECGVPRKLKGDIVGACGTRKHRTKEEAKLEF